MDRPRGRGGHGDFEPVEAWHEMGEMLREGEGVEASPEEALGLFLKAARHGFAPSQLAAGRMLLLGEGAPRDEKEGLRWIGLAAEGGLPEAEEELNKTRGS